MATVTLLLFGTVLLALVLADRAVRRLPLTPAVVYLSVGWCAGAVLGAPSAAQLQSQAALWAGAAELVVLGSLLAVGLRLRMPPHWRAWRTALLLAGPGLLVATALGTLAAAWLLELPWATALVLAAVMSPTDPVLASEVQIRAEHDRDAVRLSLTAEGGLNDGSALCAVMLGLGLMGLQGSLGDATGGHAPVGGPLDGLRWWALELAWPIIGGAFLGLALGYLLGHALRARGLRGDPLARDELLYVGAVALGWGLARATHTSSFTLVFALGATLLEPLRLATEKGSADSASQGESLWVRLQRFGARVERLVEAATVLAIGVALHSVSLGWRELAFGALLVALVRPMSVLAVVSRRSVTRSQRRLLAWLGIRGVGTLYYLAFVIESGVSGATANALMAAALGAIALSIVLHGVSATPLMTRYQARGRRPPVAHGG